MELTLVFINALAAVMNLLAAVTANNPVSAVLFGFASVIFFVLTAIHGVNLQ